LDKGGGRTLIRATEITGDYKIVFDDSEGYCFILITHGCPQPLVDVNAEPEE